MGGTMPSSRLRGDAAGASVLRARGPGGGRKHVAPHPRSSSDRHTNKKESAAESFNTEHKSGPRVPSLSIRTRPGPPRAALQAVMLMAHGTWAHAPCGSSAKAAKPAAWCQRGDCYRRCGSEQSHRHCEQSHPWCEQNCGCTTQVRDGHRGGQRPPRVCVNTSKMASLLVWKERKKENRQPKRGMGEDDRVPTCTSRILERRSGAQVGLSCS